MDESQVTETDLQAHVDGRLSEARRADVEAYLGARPEETSRLAAYRTQRDALRDLFADVLTEPPPARLVHAAEGRRGAFRLRAVRWGVAAGFSLFGLAVGATAGWYLHAWNSPVARGASGIAR